MKDDIALGQLADLFGIIGEYRDLEGNVQKTSSETMLALLRANGLTLDSSAMIREKQKELQAAKHDRIMPEEIVCRSSQRLQLEIPANWHWKIIQPGTETIISKGRSDGTVNIESLPPGIHLLLVNKGAIEERTRLICAPRRAPSLTGRTSQNHIWGINGALYGLHSNLGQGIGSYSDLGAAGGVFADSGADFLGINPVHAMGWNAPEIISPYSPSHRGFLNTAHIDVHELWANSNQSIRIKSAWKKFRKTDADGFVVNYEIHASTTRPLLEALFAEFGASANIEDQSAFRNFCRRSGQSLAQFAHFEALSDEHGPDWSVWPTAIILNHTLTSLSADEPINTRPHFHAWLQWIADRQLANAQAECKNRGMALGLYLDLAVGPRRNGAESWCERHSIADGVSLGAPPDHLSPNGQNWDLAAFAPQKLASNNYQAFRTILRQTMRHCGIIRIDHILGLNRSFWIPDDGSRGGYIRQNFDALLAIICIEAQQADTVVVGEDLGLVPSGFRETMNQRNIYSYSVLQYEKDVQGDIKPVEELPSHALVCFGTHDTPTLAGFMEGRDIDWWLKLGWIDEKQAHLARVERKKEVKQLFSVAGRSGGTEDQSFHRLRRCVYDALAKSNAAMVSVQLDDLLGEAEAQNLPGTVDEHPNWRRRYQVSVEALAGDAQLAEMSQVMMARGRPGLSTGQGESE